MKNAGHAVVYLTAFSDEEMEARATARQPTSYLLKPDNGGELCATIQVATHKRSMEATLAQRQQQLGGNIHELTTLNGLFHQQLSNCFGIKFASREMLTKLEEIAEHGTSMLIRAKTQGRPDLTEGKRASLEQEPES